MYQIQGMASNNTALFVNFEPPIWQILCTVLFIQSCPLTLQPVSPSAPTLLFNSHNLSFEYHHSTFSWVIQIMLRCPSHYSTAYSSFSHISNASLVHFFIHAMLSCWATLATFCLQGAHLQWTNLCPFRLILACVSQTWVSDYSTILLFYSLILSSNPLCHVTFHYMGCWKRLWVEKLMTLLET